MRESTPTATERDARAVLGLDRYLEDGGGGWGKVGGVEGWTTWKIYQFTKKVAKEAKQGKLLVKPWLLLGVFLWKPALKGPEMHQRILQWRHSQVV